MNSDAVFNAQQNLTFSFDRQYRIYVVGKELFFIRTGGQRGIKEGLVAQFGLIGGLILAFWNRNSTKKQEALIQSLDQEDPSELLSRHKHNFKLNSSELECSTIEPGSLWGSHGPTVGRWILKLWDGRKIDLQFCTNEDLKTALTILPRSYGQALLTVNVEWSDAESKFKKKNTKSDTE